MTLSQTHFLRVLKIFFSLRGFIPISFSLLSFVYHYAKPLRISQNGEKRDFTSHMAGETRIKIIQSYKRTKAPSWYMIHDPDNSALSFLSIKFRIMPTIPRSGFYRASYRRLRCCRWRRNCRKAKPTPNSRLATTNDSMQICRNPFGLPPDPSCNRAPKLFPEPLPVGTASRIHEKRWTREISLLKEE